MKIMISELLRKGLKAIEKEPVSERNEIIPPTIDPEKCTDCGQCYNICFVFEKRGDKPVVAKPEFCIGCGHCGSFCPGRAITNAAVEPKRMTAKDKKNLPSSESLQFLLRSRRSVRVYKKKPISRTDMETILEAGRYTPTGTNSQNIHYIVIDSPEKIEELRQIALPAVKKMFKMASRIAKVPIISTELLGEQFVRDFEGHLEPAVQEIFRRTLRGDDKLFWGAPAIMLVHGEKVDDVAFSCPVALFNCSMMAHTMGIGCCLNGFLAMVASHDKEIKQWLGIPRLHKCYAAMTLGYPVFKFNALVQRKPPNVQWI
jgi:nitroreductase/NAD-dependent dihydropyrimidine dehydrogenase PreA subunit